MTVIVNNTGFSVEYWARFSEEEFVQRAIQQQVYKWMNEEDRRVLLKQAYQLIYDTARNAKKA